MESNLIQTLGFDETDSLSHYGVKGMKWGVIRNDPQDRKIKISPKKSTEVPSGDPQAAAKAIREAFTGKPEAINKVLDKINDDVSAKDLKDPKKSAEYYGWFKAEIKKEAKRNLPNGYDVEVDIKGSEALVTVTWGKAPIKKLKHADNADSATEVLKLVIDSDGFITGLEPTKNSVEHSDLMNDLIEMHGDELLSDSEELAHYGVLGMKWGVRKDRRGRVKARATMNRKSRKDADWLNNRVQRGGSYAKAYNKTYRRAQGRIRKAIRDINKSAKYKGQDFRKDSPLRREYYSDISKAMNEQLNSSASRHGASPTGALEMHFNMDVSKEAQPTVTIRPRDNRTGRKDTRSNAKSSLRHAADDETVTLKVIFDAMGYIEGFEPAEETSLKHSEEFIESMIDDLGEELLHYGVLGMKWGVRKDRRKGAGAKAGSDSSNSSKSQKSSRKSEKSSTRSESSKRSVSEMSDEELKQRIMRIENEQRLNSLLTPPKKNSAVKKVVNNALSQAGTQLLTTVAVGVGTYAIGKAANKIGGQELAKVLIKKK